MGRSQLKPTTHFRTGPSGSSPPGAENPSLEMSVYLSCQQVHTCKPFFTRRTQTRKRSIQPEPMTRTNDSKSRTGSRNRYVLIVQQQRRLST